MKYKIIRDYTSEGWSFDDREFDTVEEAVKFANSESYSAKWLIVNVVEWEAKEL